MDKKIQSAKSFVTDKNNRTVVIATAGVIVAVAGIVTFMTARGGKAKR